MFACVRGANSGYVEDHGNTSLLFCRVVRRTTPEPEVP